MVMKTICRGTCPNNEQIKDELVVKITHVDCVHDTHNVLKDTIAPLVLDNCLIHVLQHGVAVNVYRSGDDMFATKIRIEEESININNGIF
jgi:hypothetical protein